MTYDGKLLARARTQLDKRRAANREEQQRRTLQVYARLPEVSQIDAQLRAQMAKLVRLTIGRGPDLAQELDALREENLDLQMRRAELLTGAGFGADYLDEIVSCPKCRDTGIYEGGVCSCLDRLYNAELTKELGALMRRGDESFEHFDLNYYPSEYDSVKKLCPRETMEAVLSVCKNFATDFPINCCNLVFQGSTGLGKTYLSACIARVVAQRGFSVCYETAAAALDCYERAKFSRDPEEGEAAATRIRRMESCDLMILDDLGTEMVTPMSQSALYTLVNNRLISDKKTIISTNLSNDEITKKYSPQISSRIIGEFKHLPFAGRDIRQLKK